MKLLVVNNMAAGFGEETVFDFCRACARDGDEIVVRTTGGETDMRLFLGDADEFDCVVAAGGDSTVAMVAHMLADTGIPILPYPAGTANLLAMNLASSGDVPELAKVARRANTMNFDLGEIELADGRKFGFTLIAGAGFDAALMKTAEENKKVLGAAAYFTSALANAQPQHSHISLNLDGQRVETEGVGILVINFSHIQFDIAVVHDNMPRDGVFDVVVLNTKDAFGLIPALFSAVLDRAGEFPQRPDAFEIFRASNVEVSATPPLPVQFDGEPTDTTTPFKAKVLPDAATFVVSDECVRLYS